MIEIRKDKAEAVLLTISGVIPKTGEMVGLLAEDITLGTKRRLQKIHKAIYPELLQYKQHDLPEATEKGQGEVDILNAEVIKIDVEPVSMAMIEAIKTANNYDFELIELIAK